jgi:hypothetical protein
LIVNYINRGFREDAEDENETIKKNAKESWIKNENAYYYKDPKKAIRNWLEVILYMIGKRNILNIYYYYCINIFQFRIEVMI